MMPYSIMLYGMMAYSMMTWYDGILWYDDVISLFNLTDHLLATGMTGQGPIMSSQIQIYVAIYPVWPFPMLLNTTW